MYVSMKPLLQKANAENYAVMAINCFNLETANATIKAAEAKKAPIIIDLLQEHLQMHLNYQTLIKPIIEMAKASTAAIAINLDHGQDVKYVKQCLNNGFSSVMMDASRYDLSENIRITKEIVDLAAMYDASVEGEVGNMGAVAGDNWTRQQMYTNPDEAIRFINETGVDCLALSYGSSHGDYPANYVPEFQFEIVKTIKNATNLPLVLHGGSGAGTANILQSIQLGVNKINMGSDFMRAHVREIQKELGYNPAIGYPDLIHQAMLAGQQEVEKYIELSGSMNK